MLSPVISLVPGPVNVPGAAHQFNNFFLELVHDAVTAFAGGGQTNATLLQGQTCRVSTVATAGDSVMLPQAIPGLEIMVINKGSNPMQVFGYGTDTIDDVATATGVTQMANSLVIYTCSLLGKWYTEGLATGFGGSGLQTLSFTSGLTAHAGGTQAAALALTTMVNEITTVATIADSVKLPAAVVGLAIIVLNRAANAMQVFGAGTDTIDDVATATGVAQMGNSVTTYVCSLAGKWYTEGLATGFSGSGLQTVSFTAGITAHAGGTQAAALALTTQVNEVTVVATQGDSVRLPAATAGLSIIVLNRGANPMQVFGAGTDTINSIATATGVSQGVNTTAQYICNVAGNWEVPITALASTTPIALTTNGAIPSHVPHTYVITKAGVLADTLAAPTATVDDGIEIVITSNTANAHTLTATGLLQTGAAAVNLATFAANAGAGLTLMAYQGKWNVICSVGIAFS